MASTETDQHLQALIDASQAGGIGTWVWDLKTDRIRSTPVMARMLCQQGISAEVSANLLFSAMKNADRDELRERAARAARDGTMLAMRFCIADDTGLERRLRVDGKALYRPDGTATALAGTATQERDFGSASQPSATADGERETLLARERDAREAAERADHMKDEFLATLSHELRTPLNAVLGWAQILRLKTGDASEDIRRGLEAIERNARLQTQLIDDLLDMSRIISGKVRLDAQSIDPAEAVEAAIDTVLPTATTKGVIIERAFEAGVGPISADPGRLQQIVWNLLSNAVKFTPGGGTVRVSLAASGAHVLIAVTDTGVGITAEFVDGVFDRFRQGDATTRRAHTGLGLGLAIVKQLVDLHGGTVGASSPGVDLGTTMWVQFPRLGDGER
jgi:signal transduction histidine kinase